MSKEANRGSMDGVMSKGYGTIPKLVMQHENLSIEAKAIYAYLASFAGAGDTAYPSVSIMCKHLGISKDRFYRHRKALLDNDFIRITQHQNEGGWSNNLYTVVSMPQPQNKDTRNKDTQNKDTQNKDTINNSSINNSINNNSKENTSAKLTEDFEKLWNLYPNKQGKKKAKSSYDRAIKSGTTNKEIQDGIESYKNHLKQNDWLKPAHGATWFNNERWEDEYTIESQNKPSGNNYIEDWSEFESIWSD